MPRDISGSFNGNALLREFVAEQQRQNQQWRARLAKLRREVQRTAGHPSALVA